MNLLKSTLFLGLLFISAQLMAQQTAVHAFSAKDCIEYAMRNNAQVKNALLDIQIQEQDNRSVTALALPAVNGSGNYTDNVKIPTQLLPGEFFGQPAGTYVPVQFGTQFSAYGAVSLEQTLFDGQVFVGLRRGKHQLITVKKALL